MVERTATDRAVLLENELIHSLLFHDDVPLRYANVHRKGLLICRFGDWLVRHTVQHRRTHDSAIGLGILPIARNDARIEGSGIDEKSLAVLERFVANPAPTTNPTYLIEQCKLHMRLRAAERLANNYEQAAMAFDATNLDAAQEEYQASQIEVDDLPVLATDPSVTAKAYAEENTEDLIHLGGYIGQMLKGSMTRNSLVIFSAMLKTGKTTTLCRLAQQGVREGNKVLFISIGDEGEHDTAKRTMSFEEGANMQDTGGKTLVPYLVCAESIAGTCPDFKGHGLDPTPTKEVLTQTRPEELLELHPDFAGCRDCMGTKRFKPAVWWRYADIPHMDEATYSKGVDAVRRCGDYGELRLKFYPSRKLRPSDIEDMLVSLKVTHKWTPDILVLDYPDLMECEIGKSGWERLQNIWERLKEISAVWNILILAATQNNREGAVMETQTVETLAGTKTSADNCTLMVGINQTPGEKNAMILRFNEMARRRGRAMGPEHQALCTAWLCVQDPFRESVHVFRKVEAVNKKR